MTQADILKTRMIDAAFEVTDLESDTIHLSSLHLTTLKKTEASYQSLIRNIDSHRTTLMSAASSKLGSQRATFEDDLKQHLLSQSHLESSLKLILDENDNLEKTMDKQCKDLLSEEGKLKTTESTLEGEIAELRRQLERKLNELEKNKVELASVREKIEGVRSKFSKQTEKVVKRREAAEAEKRANEIEVKKVETRLELVRKEEEEVKDKCEKLKRQAERVELKKADLVEEVSRMDADLKDRDRINWVCNQWKEKYAEESGQVSTLEEEKEKVIAKVRSLEEEVEAAELDMKKLDEKMPILEKEKKVASGARNFKEASRLAAEIKDKMTEIDIIQKRIVDLKAERTTLQDSVPNLETAAARLKIKSLDVKKFFDISQFHKLGKRIEDLKAIESFFASHSAYIENSLAEKVHNEIEYSLGLQSFFSTQYGDAVAYLPDPDKEVEEKEQYSSAPTEQKREEVEDQNTSPPIGDKEPDQTNSISETREEEDTVPLEQLRAELQTLREEHTACEGIISQAAEAEDFDRADQLASENETRNSYIRMLEERIQNRQQE